MLQKLQLRPGINRESTSLANEGTWFEMDKVRFRSGYPEKIGGWVSDTGTPYDTSNYVAPPNGVFWGVCRSLWNWTTLAGFNLLGVGTNQKYYIQSSTNGTFFDVTPLRKTQVLASGAFTTSNSSTTVVVNAPLHGAVNGDFVTISGVVGSVNGIPATALNKEFKLTYIDVNSFSIVVVAPATSNGTTGAATLSFQLSVGPEVYTTQTGWGAGGWGGTTGATGRTTIASPVLAGDTTINVVSTASFTATGTFWVNGEGISYTGKTLTSFTGCTRGVGGGKAASAHNTADSVNQYTGATGWGQSASSGIGVQLRLWSQDNYGQDLVMNPRGGGIYLWKVNANPLTYDRAVILSSTSPAPYDTDAECPVVASAVAVSDASRFVIAFGCNDPADPVDPNRLDPLLVRWSDQENYKVWAPAATNQAGSYRLSVGASIVAHLQARQEILIWTDAALFSMQYLGPPYVWGFNILADNISVVSPNAVATATNVTYWMGRDKFYMYSGRVETLYCPLRQYIFGDINLDQAYQFFASTNEAFNEVWFFYCSANSTVIDRYVIYNHLEKIWSYGNMGRTAWLDTSLRNYPVAAGYGGQIIYHENGVDDGTTNPPSPIYSYVQSADFDIGDGHNYGFVWRMIPDITFDGSTVNNPAVTFTMRPRQNPGANYNTADTPTVTSAQNYQAQRNYIVQQFTQIVYTRVRGRQMAFKISSTGLGVQWQLGVPAIDIRPDGRR